MDNTVRAATRIEPALALRGELSVPPDKSISHRAALVALLSKEPVTVRNYLPAEDTLATLDALRTFGASVGYETDTARIIGVGMRDVPEPANVVDARNSGTLIRIILGIASGLGRFCC